MNGVDENPDRAKTIGQPDTSVVVPPPMKRETGYPIEEALRPITLPANMSELAFDAHLGGYEPPPEAGADRGIELAAAMSLRARYGITRQVQLGLTYVLAGAYHDPVQAGSPFGVHAGKAVGLDVTVLITDFLGIKVGVPVYIDPVALSLAIGVPIKFTFGDKFAIGGLDDLLNITLDRFPTTYIQEVQNAQGAANDISHTTQSSGDLRISGYGIYQYQRNVAIIARFGIDEASFSANQNTNGYGGVATFLRGGLDWTPRPWVDLGFSLGFDDLGHVGTFGPEGYLALRI
jgi:hypothetical protein